MQQERSTCEGTYWKNISCRLGLCRPPGEGCPSLEPGQRGWKGAGFSCSFSRLTKRHFPYTCTVSRANRLISETPPSPDSE